jgi:uncharacterized protein
MVIDPLEDCIGFERDEGNIHKNWLRHRVTPEEAEDIFFNHPFVSSQDRSHSVREKRFRALGITTQGRRLFLVFTVRRSHIRVVSARDMSRKEIKEFNAYEEKNS